MVNHLTDIRENLIFSQLPHSELEELSQHLELVSLSQAEVLYEINEKIEYVYFPTNSIISLQNFLEDGSTVQIEMVGNEGFSAISFILNKNMTFSEAVVMQSGHAYKISVKAISELLARSEGRRNGILKSLMMEYVQTIFMNIAQISTCNCRHTLEQRFSRWLLLTFSRLDSNNLSITHETIGYLLGVRRESITEIAHKFQLNGIINTRRGKMEIKNKPLLEHKACECYETMCQSMSISGRSKKVA